MTPPTWSNDPEFQAVFHDPVRDTTMPVARAAVAADHVVYKRTLKTRIEGLVAHIGELPYSDSYKNGQADAYRKVLAMLEDDHE